MLAITVLISFSEELAVALWQVVQHDQVQVDLLLAVPEQCQLQDHAQRSLACREMSLTIESRSLDYSTAFDVASIM